MPLVSTIVVPNVVVATIVTQYNNLLNEFALICVATAMPNKTANVPLLTT